MSAELDQLDARDREQIATAWHCIVESGAWMVKMIETDVSATCNADFERVHQLRHSLRDLHRIVTKLSSTAGESST